MLSIHPTMACQIALAVTDFQRQTTGHEPKAVTVSLNLDTLVITLHEALSPAERVVSQTIEGAAKIQEFHRQLFASSCQPLCAEIQRITGAAVCEAVTELETAPGTVVQAFTNSATVQVFRLAQCVPAESWSNYRVDDVVPPPRRPIPHPGTGNN